jgi:hypothetical protein
MRMVKLLVAADMVQRWQATVNDAKARHCERSEAIHSAAKWIASSLRSSQ